MTNAASAERGLVKNWALVIVAAVIVAASALMPETEGLSYTARMSLALMLAGIICMIGEAMPLAIISLAMMCLQPFFGVVGVSEAFASGVSAPLMLIMGTFIFTVALQKTTIPTRVIGMVLTKAGSNTKAVLFGLMCAVFVLSMFVTNNAATAMAMPIVLTLIEANHCTKGESRIAKAFMVTMPLSAFYGGMTTLCGCAINVMAVGILEKAFNMTVTFVDWFLIGFPLGVVLLIVTWLIAVRVFRPEPLSDDSVKTSLTEYQALGKIEFREKMVAAIILLTIVCWILSTWVPILNTATVCLLACFLMFLPGQHIMKFEDAVRGVNWGILLTIMGVNSLATSMTSTGASAWLVTTVMGGAGSLDPFLLLLIASIVT